jgi:enoyl-CoA hydratase
MEYETLIYEKQDHIAVISLNRPQVLNAINRKMMTEMDDAFNRAAEDIETRAVVLRGNGRAFCAGFDLKEEATDIVASSEEWMPRYEKDWQIFFRLWSMSKPVVSAVHGYCFGGAFELMLVTDITIASEGTKFGMPEIRHASGPGFGLLMYSMGSLKKIKEIMLLGDSIDAYQAEALGIINEVVSEDLLDVVAFDTARRLALVPQAAMALTKRYINAAVEDRGFSHGVANGLVISTLMTATKDYRDLETLRETMGPERLREFFQNRDKEFQRQA